MTPEEILKVQNYLQKLFKNNEIILSKPSSKDAPVEMNVSGEFIGAIYKDVEDDGVSYDLNISILAEDLE